MRGRPFLRSFIPGVSTSPILLLQGLLRPPCPFLFPLAHVCFAPRSARKRWAQRRTRSRKKGVQNQRPERSEPCRKGRRGTGHIGTIPGFSHLQPNLSFSPYLDPRSYFTLSFGLPYDDAFPLPLLLALHVFLLQSPESGFFLRPV